DIGGIDRTAPLHAAADDRNRLRTASTLFIRADGIGAADRVDAQLPERAIEKTVIGASAEFAVGDEFKADPLLQPDDIDDGLIFGSRERGGIDLAVGETGALTQQVDRAQQAADMLGAKRRLRPDRA